MSIKDQKQQDVSRTRLDIGQQHILGLSEGFGGPQQERSTEQVPQWHDHIVIFPHISVVQEVVPVEPAEDREEAQEMQPALFEVHGPMHRFVEAVVPSNGAGEPEPNLPVKGDEWCSRDGGKQDQYGTIPPGHRNSPNVLVRVDAMVGLICLKHFVVDECVLPKWVHQNNRAFEAEQMDRYVERLVHDVTVQQVFHERGVYYAYKDNAGIDVVHSAEVLLIVTNGEGSEVSIQV